MTCGIYLLKFTGSSKVYVGQSKDIEARYTKHLYRLKNNLANYKLQEHYTRYGMPSVEILLEVLDASELDSLENEAIQIYDAVNNGLNINSLAGGGEALFGDQSPNSKYNNSLVTLVFLDICENTMTFEEIAALHNVNINLVRDISKGKAHRWLKNKFSDAYDKMLTLKGTRVKNTYEQKYGDVPELVHPDGTIHKVNSISEFCRIHKLNKSHISGVISKKRKSHLGWKLCNNTHLH